MSSRGQGHLGMAPSSPNGLWFTDNHPLCLGAASKKTGGVMETLDSTELFMEDQTWLDYLWDFETRGINLDLPSDTD